MGKRKCEGHRLKFDACPRSATYRVRFTYPHGQGQKDMYMCGICKNAEMDRKVGGLGVVRDVSKLSRKL